MRVSLTVASGVSKPSWPRHDPLGVLGEPMRLGEAGDQSSLLSVRPAGAAWLGPEMGCHASAGSTEETRASLSRCCDGQ